MNQIKIAHEAPKAYFDYVQHFTDYDYALVHLFEEDPEYYDFFVRALKRGRQVILDNSIFELGEAFDPDKFLTWIKLLKPTYYIVPDVLEDAQGTVNSMNNWITNFKFEVPKECRMIGVVQGKTYDELKRCYEYMDKIANVDKIAISFDYSYYEKTYPHPNKLISWAFGRAKLLGDLERDGVINKNKPHHLLGCGTPGEGLLYRMGDYPWIESVDTSNPVLHGCLGIPYTDPQLGLRTKNPIKLFTIMNMPMKPELIPTLRDNISKFRDLWR